MGFGRVHHRVIREVRLLLDVLGVVLLEQPQLLRLCHLFSVEAPHY